MPTTDALEIALSWCHLTGAAKPGRLDRLLTDKSIVYGLAHEPLCGISAIEDAVKEFARMFPGKACDVLDSIADDDRAAVRWTMRFVPRPSLMPGMPAGLESLLISPVELAGLTMCTVRDGRIVELHTSIARWWV